MCVCDYWNVNNFEDAINDYNGYEWGKNCSKNILIKEGLITTATTALKKQPRKVKKICKKIQENARIHIKVLTNDVH